MDSLQHAYDGYIIAKAFEVITGIDLPLSAELCSALVGALPDLIGEAERAIKGNCQHWDWYNMAHTGYRVSLVRNPDPLPEVYPHTYGYVEKREKVWLWWLRFIPQYGFHLLKDSFTHTSMGAQRNWYPPAEMWKENFWQALLYCWPDAVGWAQSFSTHLAICLMRPICPIFPWLSWRVNPNLSDPSSTSYSPRQ